jgi:hypothetical protein
MDIEDRERRIVILVRGDLEDRIISTGLGGMDHPEEGTIIPFNSKENAIDCLRVLIRSIEREA